MKILVLNSGSSSIKFQLFEKETMSVVVTGLVEKIGESEGELTYKKFEKGTEQDKVQVKQSIENHQAGLSLIAELLMHSEKGAIRSSDEIEAVGHRVVHGGEKYSETCLITEVELAEFKKLSFLAPLHNPANIQGIEVATEVFPNAKQVAVFDTAFHQTLPDYAYRFAIPKAYYEDHGLRVYGFHGTSHAYVSREAAKFLDIDQSEFNAITIHLGNGGSMSAIKNGKSIDVSMGLTPIGGLMMGTRSGDIDPGLILFLVDHLKMSNQEVDKLLNKKSGLIGLTGDNDLRNVQEKYNNGDPDAVLAISMYCYRIKKYIGAYTAALGKLDSIIFTAGVGENSSLIRSMVCLNLEILGIELDNSKNETSFRGQRLISSENSRVSVVIIPTNEELEIATQTKRIL